MEADRFLALLLVEKDEYKREEVLRQMGDRAGNYSMYRDRLIKRGILESRIEYKKPEGEEDAEWIL